MRVEFEMFGERQFAREILRVGNRAGDMRPVLSSIGEDWLSWNEEQFDSEGRRASGGWEQLAPSTIRSRGSDHPILDDTGALRRELTSPSNLMVTDSFLHLSIPDSVEDYGKFHQSGTVKMPRRRPLEFTDLDRREMVRKIQAFLIRGILI